MLYMNRAEIVDMKKSSPSDIAKMDSLKIPKGNPSKPSGNVPITVRFNAGEESLDDIFSFHSGGGDSLSSSPNQNQTEEVVGNPRNNFLQGNFFNRKRSGSIENISSSHHGHSNLISNLSSSDTNSVGTWKLIKGKVSQAMEDIKSSKSQHSAKSETNEVDSDQENATINSSMSDELSLDQEFKLLAARGDSDSDIDADILLGDDIDSSSIRKSFANLRSKVGHKPAPLTTAYKAHQTPMASTSRTQPQPKKDPSPNRGTIRSTFLRKRKKQGEGEPTKKGVVTGKKDVEIESGVEMFEEMMPVHSVVSESSMDPEKLKRISLGIELPLPSAETVERKISTSSQISKSTPEHATTPKALSRHNSEVKTNLNPSSIWRKFPVGVPLMTVIVLSILLFLLPFPDFLRGVFACLLIISLFNCIAGYIQNFIDYKLTANGPEQSTFQIPDFTKMPICEIPIVEEYKTVKTYTGWMNEINSYDPANFHISMTRSVYVKLEGSTLRLSNTNARVPKRQMWNEPVLDRKTITFTRHRTFNLLGCRIEMCPRGLARKRYFSRKYPMQLIIKNSEGNPTDTVKRTSRGKLETEHKNVDKSLGESKTSGKSGNDSKENSLAPFDSVPRQSSAESYDDRSGFVELENDVDFGAVVLNSDLQSLQEPEQNTPEIVKEANVPCGDETRILLFARGDREKEDWYRRFYAASVGDVSDQVLHLPNIVMVSDSEILAAAKAAAILPETPKSKEGTTTTPTKSTAGDNRKNSDSTVSEKLDKSEKSTEKEKLTSLEEGSVASAGTPDAPEIDSKKRDSQISASGLDPTYEGLLIGSCAGRNPSDYIKFMARYQKACSQDKIPVFKAPFPSSDSSRRSRREKRQEDELWKGIDQSLFLGPCGSVVWANVLTGRILFSCLTDTILLGKIQEFLQKKLSAIRLPGFMEDVSITQIHLGDTPPLIHRVSQPVLDERGTWIDADLTYEGLMHMTITTKLNLLRLKRQHTRGSDSAGTPITVLNPLIGVPGAAGTDEMGSGNQEQLLNETLANCAIYDSDAESSGASSTESDSPTLGTVEPGADSQFFNTNPGNARRLFKIVDRITASNIFQYATEISYVQRAMENMSTNITLRVELKGLVSRVTINIPPPPSDRIWLAFRGPPRLWISAKPAVGDHTFDWSIVTNVIESKLCDEVYKYLVYPNMIDVIVPFLGQSTYRE